MELFDLDHDCSEQIIRRLDAASLFALLFVSKKLAHLSKSRGKLEMAKIEESAMTFCNRQFITFLRDLKFDMWIGDLREYRGSNIGDLAWFISIFPQYRTTYIAFYGITLFSSKECDLYFLRLMTTDETENVDDYPLRALVLLYEKWDIMVWDLADTLLLRVSKNHELIEGLRATKTLKLILSECKTTLERTTYVICILQSYEQRCQIYIEAKQRHFDFWDVCLPHLEPSTAIFLILTQYGVYCEGVIVLEYLEVRKLLPEYEILISPDADALSSQLIYIIKHLDEKLSTIPETLRACSFWWVTDDYKIIKKLILKGNVVADIKGRVLAKFPDHREELLMMGFG